jgi:hypothetical protein
MCARAPQGGCTVTSLSPTWRISHEYAHFFTTTVTNPLSSSVQANRRNAGRSTGPRTIAGKRRASRNATSHGIYCCNLVLPGESNAEFHALRDAYLIRRWRWPNLREIKRLRRATSARQ